MSIMGLTTLVRLRANVTSKLSNQPAVHSQWASRNVNTSACASWAPFSRAFTRPIRSRDRRIFVFIGKVFVYVSSGCFRKAVNNFIICLWQSFTFCTPKILLLVLASSTRMISWTKCRGDRSITLQTVRKSVDQASLWNTMITLVFGKFATLSYLNLQLKRARNSD